MIKIETIQRDIGSHTLSTEYTHLIDGRPRIKEAFDHEKKSMIEEREREKTRVILWSDNSLRHDNETRESAGCALKLDDGPKTIERVFCCCRSIHTTMRKEHIADLKRRYCSGQQTIDRLHS